MKQKQWKKVDIVKKRIDWKKIEIAGKTEIVKGNRDSGK